MQCLRTLLVKLLNYILNIRDFDGIQIFDILLFWMLQFKTSIFIIEVSNDL